MKTWQLPIVKIHFIHSLCSVSGDIRLEVVVLLEQSLSLSDVTSHLSLPQLALDVSDPLILGTHTHNLKAMTHDDDYATLPLSTMEFNDCDDIVQA